MAFEACHYNLKTQVLGMVSDICRLFKSLSKRISAGPLRESYRDDGFESMFFNELAMWLVIELPRYNITDIDTAKIVEQRIKYCEEMQDSVLVFRGDMDIPNPKNVLPYIIKELKRLHQHLCQAQQAANFSDKIKSIDAQLVDAVRGTFNILNLILDGVSTDEFHVIVSIP